MNTKTLMLITKFLLRFPSCPIVQHFNDGTFHIAFTSTTFGTRRLNKDSSMSFIDLFKSCVILSPRMSCYLRQPKPLPVLKNLIIIYLL
jgi:hypothetical protein